MKSPHTMGPATDWDFGYVGQDHKAQPREQFHSVVDAMHRIQFSKEHDRFSGFFKAFVSSQQVLEDVCSRVCSLLAPKVHQEWIAAKTTTAETNSDRGVDLSIMDVFFYPNNSKTYSANPGSNSPDHADPGLFTLGKFLFCVWF